jgi:RNA polymerase sigma-70 factor (ECF subfamily)
MRMHEKRLSPGTSLAQRILSGDETALRIFFERYADPLYAFIYHHLDATPQDAEEVWQTVLLAATQSLSSYRGEGRLFTWLCSIARHKIADFRRRSGNFADVFSDLPPQLLAKSIISAPIPEEILQRRATHMLVVAALADLPDDYRCALLERYINERSVGEISKLLGRSYKATESLLSRARNALRDKLERLEEEHGDEQ